MSRSIRTFIALSAIILVLAATPGVSGQVLQSIGAEKPLALILGTETAHIEHTNGARTRLPVRAGDRITSFSVRDGSWVAAGVRPTKKGSDLLLYTAGSSGLRRLPGPTVSRGQLRDRPNLMTGDHGVDGAVWLEGTDWRSLSVQSAEWTGTRWKSRRTISPPARGSQTSLTATVLEDGTWIVAWSRFDGKDDEIYWSMRKGERWTRPRPVAGNNSVPDVTPILAADGDTAMLAWSRYDGVAYRTVLSRFQNGGWGPPRTVGPRGSVFPTFAGDRDGDYLVFRTVDPSGWTAIRIGSGGRPESRAIALTTTMSRPIVRSTSENQLVMNWPGEKETLRPRLEIIP